MAIYFTCSHVIILKFHWQVSTCQNAGDFRGFNCYAISVVSIAMFCSRIQLGAPFLVLLAMSVMIIAQLIYFQQIRLNSNMCCGDEKHGSTKQLSKTMCPTTLKHL